MYSDPQNQWGHGVGEEGACWRGRLVAVAPVGELERTQNPEEITGRARGDFLFMQRMAVTTRND